MKKTFEQTQFQLHHTGIKTPFDAQAGEEVAYFNCTIQELKPQ